MAYDVFPTSSFSLDAEAVLDPVIQPQQAGNDVLFAPPRAIFLTGVTGFVGAFLLHGLLESTEADIHALVRANNHAHGVQRVQKNLEQYDLWQPHYAARIVPVPGDLKLPLFGLSPSAFAELADTVDLVYHCGSKLSYIAPYEHLKAANVLGTQEALRLVTTGKPKVLHYVSSLGIVLNYQNLIGGQESDELDELKCPGVGYFQTKYVSEKLVRIARDRGVPTTIHRIGLVVGDSRTGASNIDDFVARMLIGCIQVGYAPDIRNAMDMTPVDYIAQAMLYLSRQPENLGKVFHLLNPLPIHWSDIFDLVTEAGYPLQKLPFQAWVQAVEENENPEINPLHPLLPFFHIGFARRMLGIEDSHFKALGTAATQSAMTGSGLTCPPIDRAIINTFLARFVATGRLAPAGKPQSVPVSG